MTNLKEVFQSDNWIITKALQGNSNQIRIDAKRRYPIADKSSFFSKWGNLKYINSLAVNNYGKKIDEFRAYSY